MVSPRRFISCQDRQCVNCNSACSVKQASAKPAVEQKEHGRELLLHGMSGYINKAS